MEDTKPLGSGWSSPAFTLSPSSTFDFALESSHALREEPPWPLLWWCREAARETWRDLRTAACARFALFLLFVGYIGVIIFAIVCLALGFDVDYLGFSTGCLPNGSFSPYWTPILDFNWLEPAGFFEIYIAFGSFSFAHAKVIDVAWDLVVGRGGQTLLAWISWRVFADYLVATMTESSLTYATYWIVYLHGEPTITSAFRLMRDFWFYRRTVSATATVFIVWTILYILLFPLAASSMTGYTVATSPYVAAPDDNLLRFGDLDYLAYVVRDGWRVNKTSNYPVPYGPSAMGGYSDIRQLGRTGPMSFCSEMWLDDPICEFQSQVSAYVEKYGFDGLYDGETEWNNEVLPPPALDISGFYFMPRYGEYMAYGNEWVDPRTGNRPFQNILNGRYFSKSNNSDTFSVEYMLENGQCPPVSGVYRWGFSSIQALVMLIMLLIWSLGTFIIWYKAHHRLPLEGAPEVPRGWRALLELSNAITKELAAEDIDITALTDRQLKREIRRRLRGGTVSTRLRLSRPHYRFRTAFPRWAKSEAWWIAALSAVAALAAPLTELYVNERLHVSVPILLWCLVAELLLVVRIGTTARSRFFMLAVLTPVCLILSCIPLMENRSLYHWT